MKKKWNRFYGICLLLLTVSWAQAQEAADSLVSVQTDTIASVKTDTIASARADSLVSVKADSLVADSLLAPEPDTLACAKDTLVSGKKQKTRASRPTLPESWKPYFVLKLVRGESAKSYRLDTVSVAYEKHLGVLDYLNDPATPERYLEYLPDYYRLFIPFTYFESPIARISRVEWPVEKPDSLQPSSQVGLQLDMDFLKQKEKEAERVDRTLLAAYVKRMDKIRFTERQINAGPAFRDNIEKEKKTRPSVLKLFKSENMKYVKPEEEAEVVIHKPNWWVTGGSGSLKLAQNYISDNWYNGGESTHSLLGNIQLFANYNDREKWQWENLLDAKLGFISAPSDEYHSYLVNNDQLRVASKLGLQAIKNWYYTITTEFKTQFCNNYGANDTTMNSAFLSPADWTTGIGMDYKLSKPKATLSVILAPLTYTMKIVANPNVDETALGLDEGEMFKHTFGSQIKANLTWNIFSFVKYTSRFDYLTSYHTVRIEWENTFDFILNRYLSATLYVYARYDDGVAPGKNGSYFQLNENFSFGLNYTW